MRPVIQGWAPQAAGLCLLAMAMAGTPETAVSASEKALEERLERMEQVIQQQQADLEAQRQQLAEQHELIRQLQSAQHSGQAADIPPARDEEPAPAADDYAHQQPGGTGTASSAPPGTQAPAEPGALQGQEAAVAELERRTVAGTDEPPVDQTAALYDPSTSIYDPNFPGAWHLPGTTAAMKIGGYVNLAVAHNFDALTSGDSFIVGSIPPDGSDVPGARAGSFVSANQTRTNIEVREETKHGTLRAFVEGDFRGDGSSFRLRHAYGQYGWLLAGKTWSTFANHDALPDEVDFEGNNGSILQRQSQLRFFPRVGKNYNLLFSIEDPTSEVQNGIGVPGRGDFIISVDSLPLGSLGSWNYKVAAVYREIEGQMLIDGPEGPELPGQKQSVDGWGITTSGRKSFPYLDQDAFIQWQLTYGKGIGHYINDLTSVGGGDAVFDPQGNLRTLPVFAGFLSYNHTWGGKPWFMKEWPGLIRGNIMFSWVDIDNYEFQADESYNKTWRAAANLFYYPTQNVRLGAEFLWGRRINKDDSKGTATQLQFSARYNY